MSYIILRSRWFHIIVLNVHAPTGDKIDDMKESFYEELKRIFDKFPKYHMKILLGDFNAIVCREDIFKPTFGNESLHKISNDNGVRVVNFATSENLIVKIRCSHITTFINILGRLQMGTPTTRLTIF
jgi:exonuclease III